MALMRIKAPARRRIPAVRTSPEDGASTGVGTTGAPGAALVPASELPAQLSQLRNLGQETLGARVVRRSLDISVSFVVLVLAAPLMLLLALVIRLDSPGPALFRQRRVGLYGEEFTFWKFRTMLTDARARYPHLYSYAFDENEVSELYFKLADDPRLTRFGRYLRRTSLDELPNFLNVLSGSMTLVGPRPEIPQMLRNYRTDQLLKFSVKPGLTGLAQTRGRNILTFQQTLAHDVDYVRARSLRNDFRILLRTPVTVVRMIGAL